MFNDYFDLKHIRYEIENLVICSLDLASIVDQPIDENGMMSVQYHFASEKVHNVQLSALELSHCFSQIEDYLKAVEAKKG